MLTPVIQQHRIDETAFAQACAHQRVSHFFDVIAANIFNGDDATERLNAFDYSGCVVKRCGHYSLKVTLQCELSLGVINADHMYRRRSNIRGVLID